MKLEDMSWESYSRFAIQDVLFEYCEKIDSLDAEGVAELFTDDCEFDFGNGRVISGRPAVAELMAGRLAADYTHTSHHVSNVRIRFEGRDRAQCWSYILTFHRMTADGSERRLHGRYQDQLVLAPEGWRIKRRKLLMAGGVGYPNPPPFELIPRRGRPT
jgi:uncharacterized protein (TIGR02246 family)